MSTKHIDKLNHIWPIKEIRLQINVPNIERHTYTRTPNIQFQEMQNHYNLRNGRTRRRV